jgi:serine/threonine-protein kinase
MNGPADGVVVAERFRIGRMLGQGGMGTVHEAVDLVLGRPVAIKVLRAGLASDERQLARFEREAHAAARLAHPNVVGVTELIRDDATGLALVMELLSGESLASRLERGPLSEKEAVTVMMQALDGLAAAHAAGMIHRDLKPANLFLVPIAGGILVKVLDFGIVKLAEEGPLPKLTRKGALIGTPTYMSPEQLNCQPVDVRSDVYSMGACLYEALVARPPYVGNHSLELIAAVGAGPPRDVRDIDRDVSLDLAHIVKVAMARDASARYQSAEAMREALRSASLERSTPRTPPQPRPTSRALSGSDTPLGPTESGPPKSRAWGWVALAAFVVTACGLGALLLDASSEIAVPPAPITPPAPAPVVRVPDAGAELPFGIDPPPEPAIPPPRPRHPVRAPGGARPTPEAPPASPGRVGEEVLDPFAH